jgi:hypothetical protein
MNDLFCNGLIECRGSVVRFSKANNVSAIIDNGVGNYQVVFHEPIDSNYTALLTAATTLHSKPVVVNESSDWDRSGMDLLMQLKNIEGDSVDADVNFAIVDSWDG